MTELIRSFLPVNYKQYEFKSGPYLGFPESHDFWGDGSVVIVAAPGHTPGSIVAFINLPSGKRFALLGDLVWQAEAVSIPAERPWLSRRLVRENDDQVRENIARVAAIHKRFPEIHMIPAHDDRPAASIPVYPASTF
jgi:glyoxylase-like metal-dependent hydrolase (beta-lactamase superfamily II)